MKCRITKEKCKIFLDLGKMPLANGFIKKKDFRNEYFFSLKVAFCKSLKLVQLVSNPNPKKMFNKNYPFYTSSSNAMTKHFKEYANWIKKKYLRKNGSILELGSNDGVFLKNFGKNNFSVGFEPSKSVHDVALTKNIKSINKFFNLKNIKNLIKKNIKFDVITGSNVICHIPNQKDLIKSMIKLLSKDGTIIFEEPYLGAMYKKTSYDQLYDEHIYMFSASSVKEIYKLHGLKLVDAIPQKTHGGSLRYIIKKDTDQKVSNRLKNILSYEKKNYVNSIKGCLNFKHEVHQSRIRLQKKIKILKKNNYSLCGYGATSKSTTILNFCNIGRNDIDCIFDTTPYKIGKYSPGMHIPIMNYNKFSKKFYDFSFLFAWNHKKEIEKKEKKYLKSGGKWITHL